jgi:hypothetical protein
MVRCHASLRPSSATTCSSAVTASTHAAAGQRRRELVAPPREQEREERRGSERVHDRDQRPPAPTEVPNAASQISQRPRTAPPR